MTSEEAQASGSTTRSNRTAIGYQDLAKLMSHLQAPETIKTEGEECCLFFQAFMAAAFTLWLTFEEVTLLQGKHIKCRQPDPGGSPWFTVTVPFRTSSSRDPPQENVYEIYLQPDEPDACFVTKLLQWIQCMVQHNVRPLEDDDFVFPDIFIDDDDDDISLEKPCPIIQVTSLMNKYARDTGIDHGSRLDPHCFRRGGAQHRLAHNQNRWPFKAVKWWGGWTDEYSTQAVLAYILDDSTRTDFGDMMSPHRIQQGRDTIWRTANAVVLSEQLKMAVEALENSRAALAKIEKAGQKRHRKIEQGFKELRQEWAEMKKSIGQATPEVHLQDASNNVHFVQRPDLPRIQSWKDVIRQWYEGEPKRGLVVPLGEWPGAWRRGNPAFYNRSVIIKEFEYFGRDEDNMRGEYGDLLRGRVNDLVGEIRARRARRAKRAKRQTRRQGAPSPTPTGPETRRKRRLEEVEDREDDDYEEEEEDEEDADKEEESDSEEDDN